MGVKINFVFSIVALAVAIVGCVLAARLTFFQPAHLSEENVTALIEEETKTYVTEEKVKKIVEGVMTALKPTVPEKTEEKEERSEQIFTGQNWEKEVLNSNLPVMVDFWAGWCKPCFMIAPLIEETAKEYKGKIKVGKLNIDENPSIARKYNIRAIPTLLFFNEGEVVDRILGVVPKEIIEDKVQTILKKRSERL